MGEGMDITGDHVIRLAEILLQEVRTSALTIAGAVLVARGVTPREAMERTAELFDLAHRIARDTVRLTIERIRAGELDEL